MSDLFSSINSGIHIPKIDVRKILGIIVLSKSIFITEFRHLNQIDKGIIISKFNFQFYLLYYLVHFCLLYIFEGLKMLAGLRSEPKKVVPFDVKILSFECGRQGGAA